MGIPIVAANSELTFSDLKGLLTVVTELSAVRALAEVTAIIRRAARALTGADGVCFVLAEGDYVHYVDEEALSPLWKGRRFPASLCISGRVIAEGRQAVVRDVYSDPSLPLDLYRPTFVRSLAMTPIRRERCIGALGAYWAELHEPSTRELELLQALADAASGAVQNAQLNGELQDSLRISQALSARRQELVRWLSHDLRNPLAVIQMATSLLVPKVAPLSSRARAHLLSIGRSAHRMDKLIHDLLDLAALDDEGVKLDLRPVAVDELLQSAAELSPLALEKNVRVLVEPVAEQLRLDCDPERIAQVLSNLVANAIRHAKDATEIRLRAFPEGASIQFEVEDDGDGLSSEKAATLFERELPEGTESGVGLGLAIARGLVEAHGGKIGLRHNARRGVCFHFTVPARTLTDG